MVKNRRQGEVYLYISRTNILYIILYDKKKVCFFMQQHWNDANKKITPKNIEKIGRSDFFFVCLGSIMELFEPEKEEALIVLLDILTELP
jgi:hypothetical protein